MKLKEFERIIIMDRKVEEIKKEWQYFLDDTISIYTTEDNVKYCHKINYVKTLVGINNVITINLYIDDYKEYLHVYNWQDKTNKLFEVKD